MWLHSFFTEEDEASNSNFIFFIYLDALHYVSCLVMKVLMFRLYLVIQSVVFKTFFIYITLLELDGEALVLSSILMMSIGNQFLPNIFLMTI